MADSQNAYLDEAGNPRLQTSIVAFLDILGFSNVSMACVNPRDAQELLNKITHAISDSRDFVRRSFDSSELVNAERWAMKFFSDNLALGFPFDPDSDEAARTTWFIIRCVQRYQLRMALNGLFLRGSVTQGPLCLTDEIIFGTALIECYQLESKASIVPRVILAEPLRKMLTQSFQEAPERFPPVAFDSICQDVDGWWFINYLQAAQGVDGVNWDDIARHKQSVLASLLSTTRHDVLPKYGWACRYHNIFCYWNRDDPGYSDEYRIDRADEQSTMIRLSQMRENGGV